MQRDELDTFFSTRLKKYKQERTHWNVPSDKIFEKAVYKIRTTGSRHLVVTAVLALAMIIMVVVLCEYYMHHEKVEILNAKILELEATVQELNSRLDSSNK